MSVILVWNNSKKRENKSEYTADKQVKQMSKVAYAVENKKIKVSKLGLKISILPEKE
ncbi:MAG: hypothetical protein JW841_05115 [Deltaproteobacteria bacterium]|nr:hypothetical protein [Deltaproteobacteria bacterium]